MDTVALHKEIEHLRLLSDPLLHTKYTETKQALTVERNKSVQYEETITQKNKYIETLEKNKKKAIEENDYHQYLYDYCAKDSIQMKKTRDAETVLSETMDTCQRLALDRLAIEQDAVHYTYKFSALMAEVQDMLLRATMDDHKVSINNLTQQYNENVQTIYENHRIETNHLKTTLTNDHQKYVHDLQTEWEKKITDATTNAIKTTCKIQETEKERDKYKEEIERLNQTLIVSKDQLHNAEERVKLANMIANQAKEAEERALAMVGTKDYESRGGLSTNTKMEDENTPNSSGNKATVPSTKTATKGNKTETSRKRKTTKDTTHTPAVIPNETVTVTLSSTVETNPIVTLSSVPEETVVPSEVPTAKKRRIRKVDTKEKLNSTLTTPMPSKAKDAPDSIVSLSMLDPDTSIEEEFEENRKNKLVETKGPAKGTKITKNKKERNVILSPEDVPSTTTAINLPKPAATTTQLADRFLLPSKFSSSVDDESTVRNEETTVTVTAPSTTTTTVPTTASTKVTTQTTSSTVPLAPLSVNLNIGSMYPNPFGKMLNVPAFKLPAMHKPVPPSTTTTSSSSGRLDLPLPSTVPTSSTTTSSSNINFKLFKMPKLKGL